MSSVFSGFLVLAKSIFYEHNENFRQRSSETQSIEIPKVEKDEMGTSELSS